MYCVKDILLAIVFGIVQGVTEWLPISSTGHMILLNWILPTDIFRDEMFFDLFSVVIQLFSVFAVAVVFFYHFFPCFKERNRSGLKTTVNIWKKAIVAVLPLAMLGILLEDKISEYLFSPITVATCLIVYGIVFILVEKHSAISNACVLHIEDISTVKAFGIGVFQALSLVPGTSRSGSTILGARFLGISRGASAEFSFMLALPVMIGASLLKIVKYFVSEKMVLSFDMITIILIGGFTAFAVSLITVKFLIGFVRSHTFLPFGVYRIALGCIILLYLFFSKGF